MSQCDYLVYKTNKKSFRLDTEIFLPGGLSVGGPTMFFLDMCCSGFYVDLFLSVII